MCHALHIADSSDSITVDKGRRGAVGCLYCGGRGSEPTKGPRCFLEQETLLLLLSTGWFQERIRA